MRLVAIVLTGLILGSSFGCQKTIEPPKSITTAVADSKAAEMARPTRTRPSN